MIRLVHIGMFYRFYEVRSIGEAIFFALQFNADFERTEDGNFLIIV